MNQTSPRGYAGLIGLLIVGAIIGLIYLRTYSQSFTASPKPEGSSNSVQSTTGVQQNIDAARNAKQLMEDNYNKQRIDLEE